MIVVLDHQDDFRRIAGWNFRLELRLAKVRRLAVVTRKVELDCRALSDFRIDFDVPARLLDEAVHLAEAKTGALTDALGGEEGFKGARGYVRRHACSVVADRNHNVLACRHFLMIARIGLVERDVRCFNRQPPAVRHGVARVDGEVDHRVLKLARIGAGGPEATAQYGLQHDVFTERALQQVLHAGDHPAGVDRLRGQRLLARKGEQAGC